MNKVKVIGGIAAVLVGVQFVGAKIVSSQMDSMRAMIENEFVKKANLPVKILNYNQGWFSTDFSMGVKIPPSYIKNLKKDFPFELTKIDGDDYFTVDYDFTHGPFVFKDGLQFGAAYSSGTYMLSDEAKAKIFNGIQQDPNISEDKASQIMEMINQAQKVFQYDYQTHIGFSGDVTSEFQMNSGDFSMSNMADVSSLDIKVPNMTGSVQFSPSRQELTSETKTDGTFQMKTTDKFGTTTTAIMGNLTSDYKFSFPTDQVITFMMNSKIGQYDIHAARGDKTISKVLMKDLDYGMSLLPNGDNHANVGLKYSIGSLSVDAGGEKFDLGHMVADVSIDHFSVKALSDFFTLYGKILNVMFTSENPDRAFKENDTLFSEQVFMQIMTELMSNKPVLNVKEISLTQGGHKSKANMMINLGDDFNMNRPDPRKITGDGNLTISLDTLKALAPQIAATNPRMTEEQFIQTATLQFAQLVEQGLLNQEGNLYKATIGIKDGMYVVNGKPVAPVR